MNERLRKLLGKQQTAIVGNHSAVKICNWTKNSLNKKGVCWKEKFYGIKSHRCVQMSPAAMWCENRCLHCWRPIEHNLGTNLPCVDDPKEILEGIIKARNDLLIGYKGSKKVSDRKWHEACNPNLFTFSLSGEPTLYPRIGELIDEVKKRKAVSFLVTNGLNPDIIANLDEKNCLPTQLTVSLNAPNKGLFKLWQNCSLRDGWERLNRTLEIMKSLEGKTRRAIRLTLVKPGKGKSKIDKLSNMEDEHVKEYFGLIKKANPDFIHVKGFMSVGFARERMGYDKMPWHYEVRRFAEKLAKELKRQGYKILGEEKRSCVIVVGKSRRGMKIRV